MNDKERILITSMLSGIEGQISAIKTILSVSANYDHTINKEPTQIEKPHENQFTSKEEDAELEKMMGIPQFEDSADHGFLSVPEIPGTLMPAPGLVESKSVASGMERAMSSVMSSIVADANVLVTEG